MAKKDQKKLFFAACLDDTPFVQLLKERKIPFSAWGYINAVKKQRENFRKVVSDNITGDFIKQTRAAINKTADFFRSLPYVNITAEYYLSFLCGLCNDLWGEVKSEKEKTLLEKIEGHLFNIYQKLDPELKQDREMDLAVKDLKLLEKYF